MWGIVPSNRRNNDIVRRNDVWDLRSLIDDFFNDSFFPVAFGAGTGIKADVRETDKEYVIDADLPGVKKEDIKLDLHDDVLTIRVEHNEETREEKDNYIRRERRYGSLGRSFQVDNVKHEDVAAKYDNGVLSIHLPKTAPTRETKKTIDIQ